MSLFGSCAEYESIFSSEYVPEGEPASITLTVKLPNMMSVTRAAGIDPEGDEAKHISDLWVGFYNAATGERLGKHYDRYDDVVEWHDHINIKNIKSLSGENYIVAVANPSLNKGLDITGGGEKSLLDLLNEADTWEKYKNLAVTLNGSSQSIQYSGAGLPMTGIYYKDHEKHNYQDCIDDNNNPEAVIIKPGDNNLSGCIQLRHVDAYVKFNIQVEDEYKDEISLTPVSWQIFNLPGVSYVHERKGECNAADTEVKELPESYKDATYKDATYHNSPVFEGAMTFPMSKAGVASFDFYQMENKHTGTAETYNGRELEFKNADNTNTGWYQSLVTKPGNEIPAKPSCTEDLSNNNASYVVIKAHLEYYYDANDETYKPVRYDDAKEQRLRVADAIYTIHLGYCEGEEESEERAADFNCRRNTKYTYNVYIAGVDKIRVEAQKEGMTNGAEGLVTDVTGKVIKLDAHYGTFNIPLSDKDRMELAWRIQAPFGDKTIKMMYDKGNEYETPGTINLYKDETKYNKLRQNQFYNWVQFLPTTGEKVLARYPGDPRLIGRDIEGFSTNNIKAASDGGVWYLEELRDIINYPHSDVKDDDYIGKLKDASSFVNDEAFQEEFNKERWYTVFVDEYVYEYNYEDNPSLTNNKDLMPVTAWGNFVNRDSRYVWLALSEFHSSSDDESFYANSAHIISQESIQTYYTGTGNDENQAIGIEATNESYNEDYYKKGYNFGVGTNAETDLPSYSNSYNLYDGRFNMYNYVKTNNEWRNILKEAPREYDSKTYNIPNHDDIFMVSCMARNRDLNGDGVIDVNEIRWYLPTSTDYIQIVLGSVSLRDPLFNFSNFEIGEIAAGKGAAISHFAASNNRMVWAEELAATSLLYQYDSPASNFRCIRNLGSEMYQEPDGNNYIDPAYKRDEDNRIIELEFYDMSGLRDYTSGHITAHSVADIRSFPSRKFQYAQENCNKTNTQGLVNEYFKDDVQLVIDEVKKDGSFANWWAILANNKICGAYSEGNNSNVQSMWRTPTISELAILRMEGVLKQGENGNYMSSSYEYFAKRSTVGSYIYDDNRHWFLGLIKDDISAGCSNEPLYLRCVRDVE